MKAKALLFVSAFFLATLVTVHGQAQPRLSSAIQFAEVSAAAGITYADGTFGASWGDFDGDGYPDLWTGNHYSQPPSLYLNGQDGTFTDIAAEVWGGTVLYADLHGAAWADFDNDGDQDMYILVGADSGTGEGPNQFFIQEDGLLNLHTAEYGLRLPLGRGRTPLWFDANRDGRLDVLATNLERADGEAPSTLFIQGDGVFETPDIGFDIPNSALFATLNDLSGDGFPDLVVHGWPYAQDVYDVRTTPLTSIRGELGFPGIATVSGAVIADFTGDLNPDIYMARLDDLSDYEQTESDRFLAYLLINAEEQGMAFETAGDAHFSFYKPQITANSIYIGAAGWQPASCGEEVPPCQFTLSPTNPDVAGIMPHEPGVDNGIYVGYSPEEAQWKVLVSSPTVAGELWMTVTTADVLTAVTPINFDPALRPQFHRYQVYMPNGYVDGTEEAGLTALRTCPAPVAGDFDNDMDLDIYLVCHREVANPANVLLENQGDGSFIEVPGAGGATGTGLGMADSAVVADYDRDGFLDLFVTNGETAPAFPSGPSQLFRNLGNSNHWLQIDLEGTISNRDGIGARVLVTAGGVTQLREQDGGIHRWSQNFQRLHFGLGPHTLVEHIMVYWPSGRVQLITDVAADQIITIVEPTQPNLYIPSVYKQTTQGE